MAAHRGTYEGFVKGGIAAVILTFYVLVALVSFRFGHSWSVFLGFAGLILGIISVVVDVKTGSKRWGLALVVLLLFGLVTAINIA
jgi:hypothetical protein